MGQKTDDRRVRRTKQLLKQSLISLMHEKSIKEITIKDITERADLNRGTFYLHYVDIYDLLEKIEDETLQNIEHMLLEFEVSINQPSCYELLEQFFYYIKQNRDLFQLLLQSRSEGVFLAKLQHLVKTIGTNLIKKATPHATLPHFQYFLSFVLNGVLGVTEQWFSNGMDLSPQEMAKMIDFFIMDGMTFLVKS